MSKAKLLQEIELYVKGSISYEALSAAVDDYSSALLRQTDVLSSRATTVYECRKELLKQLFNMLHTNGYPSEAVPKATILSLPQLMGVPDGPIA